jgi:predicted ATPase
MPTVNDLPTVAMTSLSIREFRGIERLDLNFCGPDGNPNRLVVLAGPNGCGKTAVLEAALIVTGGYKLAAGARGKRAVRRGANEYYIKGNFEIQDTFAVLFNEKAFSVSDSSRDGPPRPDQRLPHWYFSSWRAPTLVGPVDVTVGKPGRRPAKTDQNRLLNVKQQLANAAAVERFRQGQRSHVTSYTKWMETINDSWRVFYPDTNSRFFVDLADPAFDGGGAFDVFFGSTEGERLEIDCLSSGQIELFLFLSSLALNDHREGIVFIDEPELHLDPQWHRPILRTLMKLQPRAQFIVATHSPEIFDTARSYERHFLVPENDPRARLWNEARGVEHGV